MAKHVTVPIHMNGNEVIFYTSSQQYYDKPYNLDTAMHVRFILFDQCPQFISSTVCIRVVQYFSTSAL